MLHPYFFSTAIFMLTVLLNLLLACLQLSSCLAAQSFILLLILILSIFLIQELTNIFTPSSLTPAVRSHLDVVVRLEAWSAALLPAGACLSL